MPDAPRPATPSLPRLRLRLRTVMIGVFSAGVIGLAGALAWFTSQRSSAAAVEMAGEIILQVGDRVDLETRLLLQPLHFLCDHVPTLPGARNKPGGLDHPLLALFLDVLSETPQAYSLYLGYDDGDFLQAISLLDRPEAAAQLHVPPGTVFCLRRILHRGATRLEQWRYLDAGRRVLLASPPASAVYDPRTRPWYDPGRTAGHVARSPLYIFSSSREMGLTLSSPVPGPVPGVFGADMSLSSLSRFLGTAGVRQAGTVFLFETGGGLVAHPTPGVVARMQPGPRGAPELVRGTTASLDDPRVRAVARAFEAAGRTEVPLRREVLDGRAFLIQVRPAADLGDGCFLGLASPEDAFTGPMIRTRDQSLIFAAVLLLTGVPLLGMVASRLAAQVRRLTEEAERIRRLELDSDAVVDSGIDEVARLGRAVADMRSALRTFSRYLPRSLVRQLVASGREAHPGGDRREITLMFTDVEGFTPLSEHMDPEELMRVMSTYFQAVGQAILDNGGTIDKFIGDAVMAFWNAPVRDENHVHRACVAALRLSAASEALAGRGEPCLHTRVGLHCGQAVVGNLGSEDRMDYTALGSAVNLASRLEGLNKFYGTRILTSHAVRDRAKEEFLFRSVDVVLPKGTSDPVAIFELVGAMPASDYADIAAPRPMLGFCSRWERAITLYRRAFWDKALAEFTAMAEAEPDDTLARMYVSRARKLLENKPGKDWKALKRYTAK